MVVAAILVIGATAAIVRSGDATSSAADPNGVAADIDSQCDPPTTPYYTEATRNPGDEPGYPEQTPSDLTDADERVSDLPVPQNRLETSTDGAMPEVPLIQDAVRDLAEPVDFMQQPWAESVLVHFRLPNGDDLAVNAQRRTSVSRPGSHILPGWEISELNGWESVRRPRDSLSEFEAMWVLTCRYQVGVSVGAPAGSTLQTPPNSDILDLVAARVGTALETAAG